MEKMKNVRVRFAPSPTGYLHVGNARTALFNWLFVRKNKGIFVLRVEDTDIERSAVEYEHQLINDLRWIGLDWDEGPDIGGPFGPYKQSLRMDIYNVYTQKLLEEGKAYYCFCTPEQLKKEREEALSSGTPPIYSGRCRSLSPEEAMRRLEAGERGAIRLRTPDSGTLSFNDLVRGTLSFDLKLTGDPILVRSNGRPAYNYAVVIDDSLMQITHVIRGEDHISNTPRQILTCEALSLPSPQFAHLSMVMGKDNTRLSKRHGATAVDQFKKEGILPEALFNYLALLGWAPPEGEEVLTKDELIKLFDLKKVSRSSAIFDYDKLHWVNRQHIKRLLPRKKAEIAYPYLKKAMILPEVMTEEHWQWLERAVDCFLEGVDRFADLPENFSLLFDFSPSDMDKEAKEILRSDSAALVIKLFSEKISKVEQFDYPTFAAIIQEIKKETGCKGKSLYHPLRVALTARSSGLELDKFIPLVEDGTKLSFPKPLKDCAKRVSEMLEFLQ